MVLGGFGFRVPKGLDHLVDLPPPPRTPVRHCKILVSNYHTCAIIMREKGGKDFSRCQDVLRDLETLCAQFKSSWSDWWSTDLKGEYCKRLFASYNYCVNKFKHGGKFSPKCQQILKDLNVAAAS